MDPTRGKENEHARTYMVSRGRNGQVWGPVVPGLDLGGSGENRAGEELDADDSVTVEGDTYASAVLDRGSLEKWGVVVARARCVEPLQLPTQSQVLGSHDDPLEEYTVGKADDVARSLKPVVHEEAQDFVGPLGDLGIETSGLQHRVVVDAQSGVLGSGLELGLALGIVADAGSEDLAQVNREVTGVRIGAELLGDDGGV